MSLAVSESRSDSELVATTKIRYDVGWIYFCALTAGLLNCFAYVVMLRAHEDGVLVASLSTFGISAIVWISSAFGLNLVFRDIGGGSIITLTNTDYLVLGTAAVGFVVPSSSFSWVVLTLLCFYIANVSGNRQKLRSGAIIIAAVSFPMFWSKLIFTLFSGWILQADAILVSRIMGLGRFGNTIDLADGTGKLWIAAGCSSLANLSLTVLCWTAFRQHRRSEIGTLQYLAGAIACCLVVVVNIGRLCLLAEYPEYFDVIHGAIGASIASIVSTGAIVSCCLVGFRNAA
jgi:hypothetical protein